MQPSETKKAGGAKERKRTSPSTEEEDKAASKVTRDEVSSLVPSVALRSLVPGASTELVERARATVERAIKQHKVFIMFGQYSSVRRALKRRGWLEKPCDCCRVPRYRYTHCTGSAGTAEGRCQLWLLCAPTSNLAMRLSICLP